MYVKNNEVCFVFIILVIKKVYNENKFIFFYFINYRILEVFNLVNFKFKEYLYFYYFIKNR